MAAAQSGRGLGYSEQAILSTVLNLESSDFRHSMLAEDEKARKAGLWQDVYGVRAEGRPLYVKLQITNEAWAVVVSFKMGS